jgi:hypothetical protein
VLAHALLYRNGEGNQTMTLQCGRCIFRFTGKTICVAFPEGIPAKILDGCFDHTKPYPGDGGIRFVPSREFARLPEDPEDTSHLGFGR